MWELNARNVYCSDAWLHRLGRSLQRRSILQCLFGFFDSRTRILANHKLSAYWDT